jgi:hypothetical protein
VTTPEIVPPGHRPDEIERVEQSTDLGLYDHALPPLFEIAGIDEHADRPPCGVLVENEPPRHHRRCLRALGERLDEADLERRP